MVIHDPTEYEQYVQEVVQSMIEKDDSPGDFVAPKCILNFRAVGDETAILFNPGPWHEERITPSAVVLGTNRSLDQYRNAESLTEMAKRVLAMDLATERERQFTLNE